MRDTRPSAREPIRNAALEEAAMAIGRRELAAFGAEDDDVVFVLREAIDIVRALKSHPATATVPPDHIGDATVMLPRDVAESLRDYLAHKQTASGMETHRAEADGMDEELVALCEALKEGT